MTAGASSGGSASGAWDHHVWWSADGVRLHARLYPGDEGAVPLLLMPGLTRNARDYEQLAPMLAGQRRVYAIEFRGRGESGYAKDAMTYGPLIYAQDVVKLLEEEQIARFATVGTSLGGIVTMLLAAMLPGRLAAAVLNDVGPEIAPGGLDRIKTYVGQGGSQPTWVHAARAAAELHGDVYPDWQLEDWLRFAKRTCRLTPEGRIVPDYDDNIAQPFKAPGGESGGDLWPAFAAMADVPTLIVRGANSDILAGTTLEKMLAGLSAGQSIVVPRTGHAPTLDEPEVAATIRAFFDRVLG